MQLAQLLHGDQQLAQAHRLLLHLGQMVGAVSGHWGFGQSLAQGGQLMAKVLSKQGKKAVRSEVRLRALGGSRGWRPGGRWGCRDEDGEGVGFVPAQVKISAPGGLLEHPVHGHRQLQLACTSLANQRRQCAGTGQAGLEPRLCRAVVICHLAVWVEHNDPFGHFFQHHRVQRHTHGADVF